MAAKESYVIVGANLAGGSAAETLRREGFDGLIHLIGREPDRPYDRPPLSKEYLRGEKEREKLFFKPPEFYDEQEIGLRLGTGVTRLDPAGQTVELDTGETLRYDKLLLATGGRIRKLNVPGTDLEEVYYLRTIGNSQRLAESINRSRKAVVVGAGFIGSEVAASLRMKGLDVTLLEIEPVPLRHVLGDELGEIYAGIHRGHGVDLRLSEGIAEIQGHRRAERVITSSGASIDCDLVVIGVGVAPQTRLVDGTGIEVDNGILVDEYCRTSLPNIFAAGDVASWWHPGLGQRLRVEHWDNALNQGAAAARSMLGRQEPYAPLLYFWSDQYDLNIQYLGHAVKWDHIVYRGDPQEQKFTAFFMDDGLVLAALVVNRFKDLRPTRTLIGQKVRVDEKQLADESTDLKQLVK
ncbi:MAG: FAD-dependent oxidoreductase [Chloroflexi bacterium]|nr:FAD-dependent oxidoreductase [Chloroflexota bacterium]